MVLGAGAWVTRPADAATGHVLVRTLSESAIGEPLGEPTALAVERASGRLFVGDPGTGSVDVFSGAGAFQTQFGEGLDPGAVAVDEQTHDVYVAEPSEDVIRVFRPDGKGGYTYLSEWVGAATPEGSFSDVTGVAIDNSTSSTDPHAGDLYVVDAGAGSVFVYRPKPPGEEEDQEGALLGKLSGAKLEEPNSATVDAATGQVLVADSIKGFVAVYRASGTFERKITGVGAPDGSFRGAQEEEGNVTSVAVDEGSGEIYVAEAERHVVTQFDAEGKWIGWIPTLGSGPLVEPHGLAIGVSGEVYIAESSAAVVDVLGPDVIVPDTKTNPAAKITKTSAQLNGVLDGDGKAATYRFQWGTSEALGSDTPQTAAGAGEEKATAEIAGLTAGSTYYFRLEAENETGRNYGAIHAVTTRPAVEALSTGQAREIQPTAARLTGTLSPNGSDVHYWFEWGRTTSYGDRSPEPPADAGSGTEALEADAPLQHLSPNTTYHYRLVAEDSFGVTFGEDAMFTTSGPPRITSEPTSGLEHYAATLHARVDSDELETTYRIEYGETPAYGSESPPGGGEIPAGETPVPVTASLTSLEIGATYHYRVVARNSAGTTIGPDHSFTTVPPALVEGEHAAEVSAAEATLQTQINPLGHDTVYHFEYGTTSCGAIPGSCTEVPDSPADIGSGEAPVPESVLLTGLRQNTTYYYRVVATNSLGTAVAPERTFTTQEAARPFALPDGRAWEMVSPPNKHGAPVEALTREGGLVLAAEDGDALAYLADGAITEDPEGNRSPEMQQVLARRSSDGWVSQDIATPNSSPAGYQPGAPQEYQYFSPDLSVALVEPYGFTPYSEPPLASGATQKTIYLRDNSNNTYLPLVTEGNVPSGTEFGKKIRFLNATPDLSHVLIQSKVALTPAPSGPGIYEWSNGTLQLVSVLPNLTPATEAELGYAGHVTARAISNDGSRIIWTNRNAGPGHLYMRDTALGQTLQLDADQGGPEPEGSGAARFQGASADGSKVFFTDPERLTPDSTAQPTFPQKSDLYECEVTEQGGQLGCRLTDLTVELDEQEHAGVQPLLLGASEDGTVLYIVAQGVLAENNGAAGEPAQPGMNNLYVLRDEGTRWTTSFIATLSNEDRPEWEGNGTVSNPAYVTARVSPNGDFLAFMSMASLTGYDNLDNASGKPDEEVYVYDDAGGTLSCASCNPTGGRPSGVLDTEEAGEGRGLLVDRRKVWVGHWLAGNIPGWTAQSLNSALYQPRYLSNSGRLFFNSPDHLVPRASDGKENVYEYEPNGVGSCESRSGACVALISSGESGRESAFLEATPSGDDVFFLTSSPLLPQDTDTAFDIYDARVCTSVAPCLGAPPAAPGECSSTETCRPALPAVPTLDGPAGTSTYAGPGNVASQGARGALGEKTVRPAVAQKPLTRSQRLAAALKHCKLVRSRKKRTRCEAAARARYGPIKPKQKRPKAKHARRAASRLS